MGLPHPDGSPPPPPTDVDEPRKTPPLPSRARTLMRAIAIVSVFVFAGSMLMWVRTDPGPDWTECWTELLVVPGFVLGIIVAAADYLWQRRH